MQRMNSKVLQDFIEHNSDKSKTELLNQFISLYDDSHKHKVDKFNRSLPLSELFFDRWERATLLGFGSGASIYDSAIVLGDVIVGEDTWTGPNVLLDGSGGLKIGSNCSISAQVQVYSHDSVLWAVSNGVKPYEYDKTVIGNNCYIGPNVVIQKGVTIGDSCIVGANSFVNKNIKCGSKVAGNPAELIQ